MVVHEQDDETDFETVAQIKNNKNPELSLKKIYTDPFDNSDKYRTVSPPQQFGFCFARNVKELRLC